MPENPMWINCRPQRVFRIALARAPQGAVIEEVAMSADKDKADATSTAHSSRWLALPAALCGFLVTYYAWPLPDNNQAVVAATLVAVVILWVTEAIPLYISAITGSFLLLTLGDFTARAVFAPYFDPVIVLFLGGFILARGMQKYEIDHRMAHEILRRMGDSPAIFVLGLMLVTAFLSMWMSNTAAAAIMIPICVIVLRENELFHHHSRFAKGAVLAVAYAATIGGIGSLVGSPPNAIAAKYLGEQNMPLEFVEWMLKALPFVVLALVFTWLLLFFFNRPEIDRIQFRYVEKRLSRAQKLIALVFMLTALGWLTTRYTGLSSSTIALIPVIALFSLGLLDEADLSRISWSTLLLFGGGLSLGSAINQVNIDTWLAAIIQGWIIDIPLFATLLILVFFGIAVTMVASNTASAAILIPLMLPLSSGLGIDMKSLAVLIAIGVSLDFMMPVGTPPSAIAYSTGVVNVRDMIKNGFMVNIGTGLLLVVLYYFFYLE
jgi:sodium-dependent dicarboxylate transporter 2/3/5